MTIESMWGVYHADGGMLGELRYVMGVAFRGEHCSLCDITHSIAWEKGEMKEWRNTSGIPFHLVHLNERPEDVETATEGKTPCIVGETDLSLIHISEPTRRRGISYAVFCLKKKKQ